MGGLEQQHTIAEDLLNMEHIEEIVRSIHSRIPDVKTRVETGENPRGPVWIDVTNGRYGASIEWRQGMGFGLSSLPTEGQGESADETYASSEDLIDRVEELLSTGARTSSRQEALLRHLRERLRVSQEELARRLGVSQPNVCRMERRVDMNIGTLRSVVEALGGHLNIEAVFVEDAIRITQFDRLAARKDTTRAPVPVVAGRVRDIRPPNPIANSGDLPGSMFAESEQLRVDLRRTWDAHVRARLWAEPAETFAPGEKAAVWVTANRDRRVVRVFVPQQGGYFWTAGRIGDDGSRNVELGLRRAPTATRFALAAVAGEVAHQLLDQT